ncbi:MAG: RnfABCDGE type electron transport complex subunit G [Lachnospiraceae bacterium]|nr:RnfABCDGE type electron transport complex subunit G [Lachnospiraceae bacterium]
MKGSIKGVITLTIITLISGALLGYVYELTKEPIAIQREKAKQEAYKNVFEQASVFKPLEDFDMASVDQLLAENGFEKESIVESNIACSESGNKLGYVMLISTNEGYGGEIVISLGITHDGTINGIDILSIDETPGLGMQADEPEFKNQFRGKSVAQFAYSKSGAKQDYEIDALSGATITTNAMVNAVNAGLCYFNSVLKGGEVNE